MANILQPVRGTRDLIGDDAARHNHVVETARRITSLYGFSEWQTPIIENTTLFLRPLGETSDVVTKEMYTFSDRGGDSITLRPEGTAGVCRALITNGLTQTLPQKVFYQGPMFRYERPQKGRYRQFHQIGIELLGRDEALADVEVIACGWHILEELGVADDVTLNLNTLGDAESRNNYRSVLVNYFSRNAEKLSADSKIRLEKNPLRILDSKDEGDIELVRGAPLIYEHLSPEAGKFYSDLKKQLETIGITPVENPSIVRGFDYYNHTAFEFVTNKLGAQGTVLGGGRYNGLVEVLGGPNVSGVGWGAGIDRLALLIEKFKKPIPPVLILPHDGSSYEETIKLLKQLRYNGISAEVPFQNSNKKRFEYAKKSDARLAVLTNSFSDQNRLSILDFEAKRRKLLGKESQDYETEVSSEDLVPKLQILIESLAKDDSFIKLSDRFSFASI
jgi:histidyl-tRNA synthetase